MNCSKTIWRRFTSHPCTRTATVERKGKPYCTQHDPERVAIERAKKVRISEERWQREKRFHERAALCQVFCEGVSTEKLQELGEGWLTKNLQRLEEAK